MAIVFACQSCGSRFELDDRFAGKAGRCKHCGERMTIPSNGAAEAPGLKLAPAAAPAAQPRATATAGRAPTWIDAVNSQIGLAPLSVQTIPAARTAGRPASPLDDASFTGLYQVRSAPELPRAAGSGKAAELHNFYRRQVGSFQRVFRWLNDAAYLVSVPFIILLLLGAMVRNRPLALFGATVVVLLNIGRLVTGLVNLVAIPFRDSPAQGVMFLVPPLTFVYIAQHYKRLRKALRRVGGPLATLALVALVFAFVPWLTRGEKAAQGDLRERLNTGLQNIEQDVREQADRVRNLDANQLKEKAEGALKRFAPPGPGLPKSDSSGGADSGARQGLRGIELEGLPAVHPRKGR